MEFIYLFCLFSVFFYSSFGSLLLLVCTPITNGLIIFQPFQLCLIKRGNNKRRLKVVGVWLIGNWVDSDYSEEAGYNRTTRGRIKDAVTFPVEMQCNWTQIWVKIQKENKKEEEEQIYEFWLSGYSSIQVSSLLVNIQ